MLITDNSDPRCFEYGTAYTPELNKRVDPTHPDRPHFNGYGINPESATIVAELLAFYVEGRTHPLSGMQPDAESMERGHPICGDMTARWRAWRGPAGHWPRYEEAGTPYPGPRRPRLAPALPPPPAGPPPGTFEDAPLF
ncbi:hypothetical protein [Micrococcus luteus]|uniref:hypothetical protein n=1 Tax=Micrococcus luteus TaxID=1270 RepID=UPI0034DB2516